MTNAARHYRSELAIVGTGLAGFAASLFATERGISVTQVGNTGAVAYTSGYLDLFGCHGGKLLDDPWKGLARLREDEPEHPLARIAEHDIRRGFT